MNSRIMTPPRVGQRVSVSLRIKALCETLTRSATLALVLALPVAAQDYGNNKLPKMPDVAIPLTPAEKASLHAVEVRIAGVEAQLPRIDDPVYKARVESDVRDFKRRLAVLQKKYDPASAEALMHSVISRYQVTALWLAPPRVAAPQK